MEEQTEFYSRTQKMPPWLERCLNSRFLLISLGAIAGANARFWTGEWVASFWSIGFPLATLLINVSGSFLMGLFMTLALERLMLHQRWRYLAAVGFLGGFTTFSTYTVDSVNLMAAGNWSLGLLNLLGSVLAGALAVLGGIWLARRF